MADPEHDILRFVGSSAGLQAAVEFTAAETGFIPALIEKDYWCFFVTDQGIPPEHRSGTQASAAPRRL